MRKTLFLFIFVAMCGFRAHALNCVIPAGSSTATVQAAVNAAASNTCSPSTNVVTFAQGTSTISPITIPCPSSAGMTLSGPVTAYPKTRSSRPAARLANANTGQSPQLLQVAANCTNPINILFLEIDGQRPGSGGGSILVNGGNSNNLTIMYDYLHGNQEKVPFQCGGGWCYDDTAASLVFINGSAGQTNTNTKIQYNVFGNPAAGDCGNVMNWVGATLSSGGWAGYDSTGGSCNALGVYGSTTNLDFEYNIIQNQEQGTKWYEGCQSSSACYFYQINDTIAHNDFAFIHRIPTETQQSPTQANAPFSWNYNDVHDLVSSSFGTWILSGAQNYYTNMQHNVVLYNGSGAASNTPGSAEFWGNGQYLNNMVQGTTSCGMQYWTAIPVVMTVSKNIFQGMANYVCDESSNPAPIGVTPTAAATNMVGATVTAVTSAAPSISPNGGSFASTQVVTVNNAGSTSGGMGPQGNTGSWCTTDGTNPVPGSGSAVYYNNGDTLTLTASANLKCVGMWGAITQPVSYPSGFGFTPSAVVTAAFTGGGVPPPPIPVVLTGGYLSTPNSANTLAVAGTLQFAAVGAYSDGTTNTIPMSQIVWASSNPAVLTVNSGGLATAVSAGAANVGATVGAVPMSQWTVTVSGPKPPPIAYPFVYLISDRGINFTVPIVPVHFYAIVVYADGTQSSLTCSGAACADTKGTYITSWTSSVPAIGTISSSGAFAALTAGITVIQANLTSKSTGAYTSNSWSEVVGSGAGGLSQGTMDSGVLVR